MKTLWQQRSGNDPALRVLRIYTALLAMLIALAMSSARNCAAQQATTSPPPAASNSNPPPLTGPERWNRYMEETYLSPGPYVVSLGAGLAFQALDYPREWGGGFAGYARRTGNQFGIIVLQNSIHEGGEAAFRYDPRYFPCRCTGFWRRTAHAFEMSFLTYDQNGHKQLDIPQIAGAYGSGVLSALWNPRRFSPWVQGIQTGHMQFGFVIGTNMFDEFRPEFQRVKLFRIFIRDQKP